MKVDFSLLSTIVYVIGFYFLHRKAKASAVKNREVYKKSG